MKALKEALFSKKNLENYNPYGLTKKDLKEDIKDFPIGIVVRMLEEQVEQGNKPDVKVFQKDKNSSADNGGFDWAESDYGGLFWQEVLLHNNFYLFFEQHPEYEDYN